MSTTYDPYAPPRSNVEAIGVLPGRFSALRVGKDLAVETNAPLPPICLKCASRGELIHRRQNFVWVTPWVFLALLVHLLVLLILYLVLRKKGRLDVPLCPACHRRWRRARLVLALSVVWIFAGGALAIVLIEWTALALAVGLTMPLVPLVTTISYVRPRTLIARRIDDRMITLRGVAPGATEAILAAAQSA